MKKKGTALATVLIIATALLIIGTAVSAAVINTTKFNVRYSDDIDLELAAKSGLNIAREDLINKINLTEDSVNLPTSVPESKIDFDFDNINVTTEIIRDPEIYQQGVNVYKYKIISRAEGKKEEQIITVNIENINGEDGIEPSLELKKYISIGGNVNIGTTNGNSTYTANLAYGGDSCITTNNSSGYNPENDTKLKELKMTINKDEVNNINKIFNSISPVGNSGDNIEIINKDVIKYEKLSGSNININIDNSNVMFESGGEISNDNRISALKNSTLVFNGNFVVDKLIIDKMNSSIMIVNGDLVVRNGIKINSFSNNIILVTGNLDIGATSGYSIYLDNSILIVAGNINIGNTFDLAMGNSALVTMGDLNLGSKGFNGSSHNSFILANGNLNLTNGDLVYNFTGSVVPNSTFVINSLKKFIR